MISYKEIILPKYRRGFHIITDSVLMSLGRLPEDGLLNLFIKHTSAGLCINENADQDVLHDFEFFFNRIVPEGLPQLRHTLEGADDMPAHIKSSLVGHQLTIPIIDFRLALGVWQGIYLCEFRNRASSRHLIATIYQ